MSSGCALFGDDPPPAEPPDIAAERPSPPESERPDPAAGVRGDGPSRYRSPAELALIPDAVPRNVPRSRYGNPDSYEVFGETYHVMDSAEGFAQRGYASWYGTQFHGRRTSSGTPYDMYAMTAAHRELPLPTWVEVINLENDRRIVVKVNDRGPFVDTDRRVIDLSYAAAVRLDMADQGTAPVKIRVLEAGASDSDGGHEQQHAAETRPFTGVGEAEFNDSELADTHHHHLQAGIFASRDNAERARAAARGFGAEVAIDEIERAGQTRYRVRLGPLANTHEQNRLAEELAEHGIETFPVVLE
ncbi:hypothetical protein CKO15_01740 [Halorhodospira abdelmalekii]|uniref:septal ring lytic transglycosylase RlpA family protein n=1 Tax=Halorhodospira abdelmalekii TaxID=421629 RepID=UPI00190496DF|nr:septal ring lytic transglycosylase RlpA family protein [Halorhodospira abdelmalekii]MBK1734023.1 hypothetical protein [Halorhodospira abdelmalekii]